MVTGASGIIDIIFLASGVYLIFTAVMAKKNGNIASNVMLGKNMSEKDIKDKIGFIDYMYKRMIAAGVIIILASAVYMANDYYVHSTVLTWVGIVMILVAIVIYTLSYLRGRKRYIQGYRDGDRRGAK